MADDAPQKISWTACLAEFFAMMGFVIIGCGYCALGPIDEAASTVNCAFVFGLAIAVTVYAVAPLSGGQVNPAVTMALILNGNLYWLQGFLNIGFQYLAAYLGAVVVYYIMLTIHKTPGIPGKTAFAFQPEDGGGGEIFLVPGTPSFVVNDKISAFFNGNDYLAYVVALISEGNGTALLVFVVLELVRAGEKYASMLPLVVGLAVFLAHCMLIPITGCSINPARAMGPAIVCMHKGIPFLWVMSAIWVCQIGPYLGAITGWGLSTLLHAIQDAENVSEDDSEEAAGDDKPADAEEEYGDSKV